ncbi:MAG: hypothetical protein GX851_06240 [Clostridiales bacterium]|nr:hypothetical protein [Clostridiales bacterium]
MEKKHKRATGITVIICLLAIVLLLAVTSCDKWFGGAEDDPAGKPVGNVTENAGSTLDIDPNAGDYVPPESTTGSTGGIAIPGWNQISIPDGETEVTVDFPNPGANAEKYYLSFELRLKDTGEVLYKSGLVPPGQTIQHITLSRALTEGTYKAVIHVQPYKMDENRTSTNNADMETDLVVYKA